MDVHIMRHFLWLFALVGIAGCLILLILFFIIGKHIDKKAEQTARNIISQERDS